MPKHTNRKTAAPKKKRTRVRPKCPTCGALADGWCSLTGQRACLGCGCDLDQPERQLIDWDAPRAGSRG